MEGLIFYNIRIMISVFLLDMKQISESVGGDVL